MEALPTAEKFIRATLKARSFLSTTPIEPAPYKKPDRAIAYKLLANPDPLKSSDGQNLVSTFIFQVVATEIAENIGGLVDYQSEIKSALHFDFDRMGLLPYGILACQCEREIKLPEPTAREDVRQNLGFVVRLSVLGSAGRAVSNLQADTIEGGGGSFGRGGTIGG